MNVSNKFLIFLVLLLNINLIFSFNVCNVDIDEPWFITTDSSGNDVLIVDNEGDIYFEGQDHSLNNVNSEESFEIGLAFFNKITSKFNSFTQDLGVLPAPTNSLVIKSDLGIDLSSFDENGNIYTTGQGVYENSQAGCLPDGGYCVGNVREDRDYFCDITGSKTGVCDMNVVSSEDCLTKLSTDTDGGNHIYNRGTLKDFISCSNTDPNSFCTFNSYTDYCIDSSNLVEYYSQLSTYQVRTVNENEPNFYYCDGTSKYIFRDYICSNGEFLFDSDTVVETCIVPSPSYSFWSCISDTQRRRTITTYYPECSVAGGCSQSDVDTFETQTAPSGYLCGGGNWVLEPKLIGISAIPSSWILNLPGSKSINVCMSSQGANSCTWCGISIPCNGCKIYINSGNYATSTCLATAKNSYHQSDSRYGSTTAYCSGIQQSSTTYTGWGGSSAGDFGYLDNCYEYNWIGTGFYSACSVSCGGGIQYEDYICQRSDGVTVSDSKCLGTEPVVTKTCNTQSCVVTPPLKLVCYTWGTPGSEASYPFCCGQAGSSCTNIGYKCQCNDGAEGAITYICNYEGTVYEGCGAIGG